jgi:hypothetical protein
MENKPTHSPRSKTHHATLTGTFFFTVLNLIFLSLLAWFLLEMWFGVRLMLESDAESDHAIQIILRDHRMMLTQDHSMCLERILTGIEALKTLVRSLLRDALGDTCIDIFFNVTEIIVARSGLFLKFMPFMLIILSVLIIDGLVLRDKRKFQGARESTFLFHRLKELAKVSFFSLFFMYMVIPYSLPPSLFWLPMAFLSSLFVMLSIKSFKKYV